MTEVPPDMSFLVDEEEDNNPDVRQSQRDRDVCITDSNELYHHYKLK
jgi:hypothetical protein